MGEAQPLQSLDFADARGAGRIVFNPDLAPHPKPEWFDASYWGEAGKPVTSGGRGAAWFVEGPFGRAVLRQYLRCLLLLQWSRLRQQQHVYQHHL